MNFCDSIFDCIMMTATAFGLFIFFVVAALLAMLIAFKIVDKILLDTWRR